MFMCLQLDCVFVTYFRVECHPSPCNSRWTIPDVDVPEEGRERGVVDPLGVHGGMLFPAAPDAPRKQRERIPRNRRKLRRTKADPKSGKSRGGARLVSWALWGPRSGSYSARSQKRQPIWFPHCPTCTVITSRGIEPPAPRLEPEPPRLNRSWTAQISSPSGRLRAKGS